MKVIAMLSGGIDSPVAAFMALRAGLEVTALHFDNRPFTDNRELEKTRRLVNHLAEVTGKPVELLLAPHGINQITIARKADRHLQCVLCRRQMYRTAGVLARKIGAAALVNGESLGQVASQTLANLQAIDACSSLPILRPLIGLDKIEIERVARRIGTFELSTLPSFCCSIVPEKPATAARLDRVEREEAGLPLDKMVELAQTRTVELDPDKPLPEPTLPGGAA